MHLAVLLSSSLLVLGAMAPAVHVGAAQPSLRMAQASDTAADRRQQRSRAAAERKDVVVACTRTGCNPAPRGCTVRPEAWDGMPTGYDEIICPPRR